MTTPPVTLEEAQKVIDRAARLERKIGMLCMS